MDQENGINKSTVLGVEEVVVSVRATSIISWTPQPAGDKQHALKTTEHIGKPQTIKQPAQLILHG